MCSRPFSFSKLRIWIPSAKHKEEATQTQNRLESKTRIPTTVMLVAASPSEVAANARHWFA
jgi:hypothetical protein